MVYKLAFHIDALDEWKKLDGSVRSHLKKKLEQRLGMPRVESARISGGSNPCKIKLRTTGYRLVYQVQDSEFLVLVVAVGKRERNAAYEAAIQKAKD